MASSRHLRSVPLDMGGDALGDRYREPARRAIDWLVANAVPPACNLSEIACVGANRPAGLGATALALTAIAEYQLVTGDRSLTPLARRMGRFIIRMQKDSGDFCHQYDPYRKRKDCSHVLLYYSGEAVMALSKLFQLTGDRKLVPAIRRAMDFLVDDKYDFFLGKFFISEDHWTCIGAEAAYDAVADRSYLDFCVAFAELNRRAQIRNGPDALADLAGAFAITPFFVPHNTPVGSRTEANVATWLLVRRWGDPSAQVTDTVRRSLRYLVDQQIRPEGAYLMPNPAAAAGAMMQTPVRPEVRIDYVQHAAAAMLRALPLL